MMLLKEIELETTSLASTKAFYGTVLGFPVQEEKGDRISLMVGWTLLSFRLVAEEVPLTHFAFLIPSSKVAESCTWIAERVPVLPYSPSSVIADFRNWNAHAFYFHDNNGNILECIAHHNRLEKEEEPFSAQCIEGICEIGLVTEDVPAACRRLREAQGVPYFDKGPQLPDFAVMGGVEGRMIVSGLERGWIPTGQPALPAYCRIVSEVEGQKMLLHLQKGIPY